MDRVKDKVAFITGAASGIGAACARLLAQEGAKIVLADVQDDMAREVLAEIEDAGGEGHVIHLDVTSEENWLQAMAGVLERFGALNILINCAGTTHAKSSFPSDAPLDEWRNIMSVNLDGTFLATKHGLGAMKKSTPMNGSIINISSVYGMVGLAGIGAYNASKGGVRIYSKSVALSCAQEGVNVRVNTIHPGIIDTPLLQRALSRNDDPVAARKAYDALQPVGHLGAPEDIAFGALYLASDEAKFVTGAELVIDGGYTAR